MLGPTTLVVSALALAAAVGGAKAGDFHLTSSDIAEGKTLPEAQVFYGSGYHGGNHSPALAWSGEPAGTKSFAVTVFDPDAPTGRGWWHWTVFNIPASIHALPAGVTARTLPQGAIEGITDFKKPGYGGAAPPAGKPHHYVFTVYALDVERLELSANADGHAVAKAAAAHVLAKSSITTLFGR